MLPPPGSGSGWFSVTGARPSLDCRVDYGVALGTLTNILADRQAMAGGAPGIVAGYDPIEVGGFAVYRSQPGTTCPPPIVR